MNTSFSRTISISRRFLAHTRQSGPGAVLLRGGPLTPDTLVASGSYASGSEVVGAGLRALQERDAAVEKWLRGEVIGVCDTLQSDPGRAIPGEQVFATIRARHADRLKKRREPQD
jgi:antitoxin ParD1/3/4